MRNIFESFTKIRLNMLLFTIIHLTGPRGSKPSLFFFAHKKSIPDCQTNAINLHWFLITSPL